MQISMLKCKIHRATVTDANLNYEGSISIDPKLSEAAGLRNFERVDVVNINNGQRFSTYVIPGKSGEICLNGAAARLVHQGDLVIVLAYASMTEEEAEAHSPRLVFVDENNAITQVKGGTPVPAGAN
jgi:aspartate 1-decarboxylase